VSFAPFRPPLACVLVCSRVRPRKEVGGWGCRRVDRGLGRGIGSWEGSHLFVLLLLLLLLAAGEGVKGLGERQNGGSDVFRGDGRCG